MSRKALQRLCSAALLCLILINWAAIGIHAETYTPDGNTEYKYLYPAGVCNRTINVNLKDNNGNIIKKIVYYTKTSVDESISITLNGYNLLDFSSDVGMTTKCELTYFSGCISGQL